MSQPRLLPPSDLLEQVQGVEQGLLRGRRLHWVGLLVAASQITVLLLNSDWLQALFSADWSAVLDRWWLILPLFVLVFAVLLASWTRFWLKESKEPFRYTFAIAPFNPVTQEDDDPRMHSLQTDLLEKLSRRVGRLSLRTDNPGGDAGARENNPPGEGAEPPTDGASHIHITGYYAKRRRRPDPYWGVEVTAWVRVGGTSHVATLAPPVRYGIRAATSNEAPVLDERQYEDVLERAYSSIATAIYKQIQHDVARKIDLLPSRYFRAAAYFYEAEDYARSNTLDAYDRALELYDAALRLYDPNWKPTYRALLRRPVHRFRQVFALALQRVRRAASHGVARIGKIEVLAARAQIGYVNTLISRRILAGLAGSSVNPIFEAWPVARRAVKRLCQLADDVPGREESLFDAYVARALALSQIGQAEDAERDLSRARAHDPYRAEQDPRLLFASGLMEVDVLTALPRLRRAVEFDPYFEVAQFQLAWNLEMLWRMRPELEENVAEMVFDEYEGVLRLNPGNVAAWANLGYMHWLLAGTEDGSGDKKAAAHAAQSRDAFESGRQYKEIKHEAFVGELDHGLTRLAAEKGCFREAYRHYANTVSAVVTQGRSAYPASYSEYQLGRINAKMRRRFTEYRDSVRAAWEKPSPEEARATTQRVRDAVYAFVLNDFAEASYHYYLQSGDLEALDAAHAALIEATSELRTGYVVAYVNLAHVEQARSAAIDFVADEDPGGSSLDYVDKREPGWAEGNLLTLVRCTERARELQSKAQELLRAADELTEQAARERRRSLGSAAPPWLTESRVGAPEFADYLSQLGDGADARERTASESELDAEAAALRREAAELEREAQRREARARELTVALLPHDWLWKADAADGDDGAPDPELDARALSRRDYGRELKWERSFDDFHVRALFTWCRRRRLTSHSDDDTAILRVLDLIEGRFWPSRFELLSERRYEQAEADAQTAKRRIRPRWTSRPAPVKDRERTLRAILLRQYREDPDAYYALWALTDNAIPEQTRRDYYIDAAAKSGRPPALYKWLGDRLLELGAFDEALAAYENVVEDKTTHAATLLELGQQFDSLGRRDAALQALRRAATSDDPALLVSLSQALSQVGAVREAVDCLERAAETEDPALLTSIADGFEQTGAWEACVEVYRRAAEGDRLRPLPSHSESFYHLRLGRSLLHRGAPQEALRELVAVQPDHDVAPRWRTALVEELAGAGRLTSRTDYFLVRSWLLSEQRVEAQPENAEDVSAALLGVARSAYPHLRRAGSAEWETEVASRRPIGLQADRRFFPQLGDTPAVVRMIESDIPAIQERIRVERGAYMPGVRIQGRENFGRREYRILLHELEHERGRVPRGVADPYAYMLERLERLVRENLATFIDVQSVENLLAKWEHDDFAERVGLRSGALPDAPSMRRFVQIVEELVREEVPIVDLDAILRTFDAKNLVAVPLHQAVDAVRQELRPQLPGLDGRPLVSLPETVEAALSDSWNEHGHELVAFRDHELERLRASVRKVAAQQDSGPFAFVVKDAALRFFANRLVEMDCPSVPVVSAHEAEQDRTRGLLISPAQLLSRAR